MIRLARPGNFISENVMAKTQQQAIADFAHTLAELRNLPLARQSLLLLARLDAIYAQTQGTGGLNKHNLLMAGDPHSLGIGFSHAEESEARRYLLGLPWTTLVNQGYIVDPSGNGFYSVSEEGRKALASEESAAKQEKQPLGTEARKPVDEITGILTRGALNNDLDNIEKQKHPDVPWSFLMIDIDHFRDFNTNYGHPVGDKVLRIVAQTLASVVRRKGEAYRYGGEELSVILPNHNVAEARAVAERIRSEVEAARISSLPDVGVTISLGVASVPETSESVAGIVADADRVLYQAKNEGRNRVCFATKETSGMPVANKNAAPLEDDLQMWIRLQSGERSWYLLEIENQTKVEVRVERISVEHDGFALMEPAFPSKEDNWVLPTGANRPIGFRPKSNPGDALIRLFPNEGIQFNSWVTIVLRVSYGKDRRDYSQKLAVRVSGMNGQVKQLAG